MGAQHCCLVDTDKYDNIHATLMRDSLPEIAPQPIRCVEMHRSHDVRRRNLARSASVKSHKHPRQKAGPELDFLRLDTKITRRLQETQDRKEKEEASTPLTIRSHRVGRREAESDPSSREETSSSGRTVSAKSRRSARSGSRSRSGVRGAKKRVHYE